MTDPFRALMQSLSQSVIDMQDLDEIECIIANLIYNKWVKGYVHHMLRKLVLGADPFPIEPILLVQDANA